MTVIANYGFDPTDSRGTTVTAGASPHGKGAWVELVDSAPFDVDGVVIQGHGGAGPTAERVGVDLGVGPTTPTVAIEGFLFRSRATYDPSPKVFFPRAFAEGDRIWARIQSTQGSYPFDLSLTLYGETGVPGFPTCVTYGYDAASTDGKIVTSGSPAHTKPTTYTEITTSDGVDVDTEMLIVAVQRFDTAGVAYLLDLATGVTSPAALVENVPFATWPRSDQFDEPFFGPFVAGLAAGTRVVARLQSSTAAKAVGVVLYGFG